jgi:hypothetical protein
MPDRPGAVHQRRRRDGGGGPLPGGGGAHPGGGTTSSGPRPGPGGGDLPSSPGWPAAADAGAAAGAGAGDPPLPPPGSGLRRSFGLFLRRGLHQPSGSPRCGAGGPGSGLPGRRDAAGLPRAGPAAPSGAGGLHLRGRPAQPVDRHRGDPRAQRSRPCAVTAPRSGIGIPVPCCGPGRPRRGAPSACVTRRPSGACAWGRSGRCRGLFQKRINRETRSNTGRRMEERSPSWRSRIRNKRRGSGP